MKIDKKKILKWVIEILIIAIIDMMINSGNERRNFGIEIIIACVVVFCVEKILDKIQGKND